MSDQYDMIQRHQQELPDILQHFRGPLTLHYLLVSISIFKINAPSTIHQSLTSRLPSFLCVVYANN